MDPVGDPLETRTIQMVWGSTIEPDPSRRFFFIDDVDAQFGNGSIWTWKRTRSDGPEPLPILFTSLVYRSVEPNLRRRYIVPVLSTTIRCRSALQCMPHM